MTALAHKRSLHRVWKSVQLYIGFHRDQRGNPRDQAKVWPPKNANATIHANPEDQEAFLIVKSADQNASRDVQLKLHPDQIIVRREEGMGWRGIIIEDDKISVQVNGSWVRISANGAIAQDIDGDRTFVEPDGSVLKMTEFVEAHMSSDGVELSRRTDTSIAAIRHDGVVAKARD